MAHQSEIDKLRRRYEEKPSQWFAALAEEYRRAGEIEQALEIVRSGLEERSNYVSGYIVLARCLLDRGDDQEAEKALEHVLDLDSENIIALKVLGEIAERAGTPGVALGWFRRLLEVDPMNEVARETVERLEAEQGPVAPPPIAAEPEPEPETPPDLAIPASAPAETVEVPEPGVVLDFGATDTDSARGDLAAEPESSGDEAPEPQASPGAAERRSTWEELVAVTDEDAPDAAAPPAPVLEPDAEVPPEPEIPMLEIVTSESEASLDFESLTPEPSLLDEVATEAMPAVDIESLTVEATGASHPPIDAATDTGALPELEPAPESDPLPLLDMDSGNVPAMPPVDLTVDEPLIQAPPEPEPVLEAEPPTVPTLDPEDGFLNLDDDAAGFEIERTVDPVTLDAPVGGPLDSVEHDDPQLPEAGEGAFDLEDQSRHLVSQADAAAGIEHGPPLPETAPTPVADAGPGAESADDAAAEPRPVVTETMAEVYVRQGLIEDAKNVYRQLLDQRPHDPALLQKLAALDEPARPPAASEPEPAVVASRAAAITGGQSTRDYLSQLLGGTAAAPGVGTNGPAVAAATEPAPAASDTVSLAAVFGDEAPVTPSPDAGNDGLSFDEFFGGGAPTEPSAGPGEAAPGDQPEDQAFKNWLKGLKS